MDPRRHNLKPILAEVPESQPERMDAEDREALLNHIARLLAAEYIALSEDDEPHPSETREKEEEP